jgi:gliding motility-associated-like protein
MPKSFTPGKSNFQIPAVDPAFNMSTFSILDGTGKVVWQTSDISKGWDGKIKGEKAASGTYSYAITGTLQTGKINVKGTVQLVR